MFRGLLQRLRIHARSLRALGLVEGSWGRLLHVSWVLVEGKGRVLAFTACVPDYAAFLRWHRVLGCLVEILEAWGKSIEIIEGKLGLINVFGGRMPTCKSQQKGACGVIENLGGAKWKKELGSYCLIMNTGRE